MPDVTITLTETILESWRTILAGWYAEHPSPSKPDLADDVEVVRACAFHGASLFTARSRVSRSMVAPAEPAGRRTWDDERAERERMRRAYAEGRGLSPAELVQRSEEDQNLRVDILEFDEEVRSWQQADRELP
jgi:hypothetical protein